MAYLKPPWFVTKVFNKLAMGFGVGGSETLVVSRRSSGEQTIPVIPCDLDGVRYIVSSRGESAWVRNLRAAGGCELRSRSVRSRDSAAEVPVEQRAPIIAAYRAKAGKTVASYWEQLPEPADHPTFVLTPV